MNKSKLYVEFSEESSVNYIYKFAPNLKPDHKLHLYVPPCFYQKFRVIDDIYYSIRMGLGNHQTRIRFNYMDLILYKRSLHDHKWSVVPLKDLPTPQLINTTLSQNSDDKIASDLCTDLSQSLA